MLIRSLGITPTGLRPALSLPCPVCRPVILSLLSGVAAHAARLRQRRRQPPPALAAPEARTGLGYSHAIEAYEQLIDALCMDKPV